MLLVLREGRPVRRNTEGALILGDDEMALLAQEMIARRLSDPEEWADWELVPMLSEDGHERLIKAIYAATNEAMADDLVALEVWSAVQ